LPHKVKLFVPGNHDRLVQYCPDETVKQMKDRGITILGSLPIDNPHIYTLENGLKVLGLPFVTNLPYWAFNRTEQQIEDYLKDIEPVDIVVSHSPLAGILDGRHYGVAAYWSYLDKNKPKIWICGHVHESYGTKEVSGCKFYNVCACDEDYMQVNPAMEIELE